ncbi:MAG: hypothetical protein KC800_03835 [Candidatus Eremiobacteraeota bacterium]|nr:hypothetical protein [Candidatus Eremiobacteraeota bacterium]
MDEVRPKLRRLARGTTLPELLIGFGLLGLLSVIIFLTLQGTRTAKNVHEKSADRATTLMLTRMRLLDSLRAARVLYPNREEPDAVEVQFQQPRIVDGFVAVDVVGRPLWDGTQSITFAGDGKLLLTDRDGQSQILGRLGPYGSFRARREAPFLKLELTVQREVEEPSKSLEFKVHVPDEVVLGSGGSEI